MIDMIALKYFGNRERTLRMWVGLLAFTTALYAGIAFWGASRIQKEHKSAVFWHEMATKGHVDLGRGRP